MEITIPVDASLLGGMLSLAVFVVIIWLAFKAIKTAIFWAALGGIPIFKITGTLIEMALAGETPSEIGRYLTLNIMFFLKPIDDMLLTPPEGYEWIQIPLALLLGIWLILCIRWATETLTSKWLYADPIWGIPMGLTLWYILTGTAHGLRTLIAEAIPPLQPVLTTYSGSLIIPITILAVLATKLIKTKKQETI